MNNLKILIAEDDDGMMYLLSEIVEEFCIQLFTAINGVEAVEVCRNNPDLDLVLMDIRLPIMDGLEATIEIRKFNKQIPIIAQTAFAFPNELEILLKAGCNDFITKPIDEELLMILIDKHCGKR